MIFFDTSVLLATLQPAHVRHRTCLDAYTLAERTTHASAAHCMVELYAKLTGPHRPPRMSPRAAFQLIREVQSRFLLIALDPAETLSAIHACIAADVTGATVHDAQIVACARKAGATSILTLNTNHFRRAAPDLADIIREP